MSDVATVEPASKPFWAKCGGCEHCWPIAYYPLEAELFAKIALRGCICPKCGVTKIFVAKQDSGVLLEPAAAPQPVKPEGT